MSHQLIKLPNGSWIDPKTVFAVRPLKQGDTVLPRVIVHYGQNQAEILYTESNEQAFQLADNIVENFSEHVPVASNVSSDCSQTGAL